MQVPSSSFMTDFIEFKDEIFKKIRLLESKVMTEINSKFTKIFTNYEQLDNRMNYINQNYDSLLESLTNQKVNLDKISECLNFKNKAEQNIITHNLKLKNISSELDKMKLKYDKLISDNLKVPGLVGSGCQYKTISAYITNHMVDFSKLKNEKEQIKTEIVEIRIRLDNILKSTVNLIDTSIATSKKYADNKYKEMINVLDRKIDEMNEKNMEIRTQMTKNEINSENHFENLKNDIQQLIMKNENLPLMNQKIEEQIKKIEELSQKIEKNNMTNFEKEIKYIYKEENKSNDSIKDSDNDNNYNNNKNKEDIKSNVKIDEKSNVKLNVKSNVNLSNNNIKKGNFKLIKNYKLPNNKNNTDNINIEHKRNSVLTTGHKNKIDFSEYKRLSKNNIIESESIYTKIIKNIQNNNEFQALIVDNNEDKKTIDENDTININKGTNFKDEKGSSYSFLPLQAQEPSILNIEDIKEKNLLKDKKNINSAKIKIESIEKKKSFSYSANNIMDFINKKNELENNNIVNNQGEKSKILQYCKLSKKRIIHRRNNESEDYNTSLTPKGFSVDNKSERKKIIIYDNEEQKQIMNEIKTYYNQKKERYEQRSQKNVVDCNIINLNLEKPSKIFKYKSASNKHSMRYNKESKQKIKNRNEIGIKSLPVFGRTTYSFYNKKDIGINHNGLLNKKKNNLKDNLNKALLSSIKAKIFFQDKEANI